MKRKLKPLSDCLFGAFANWHYDNPQDAQQMWAIIEGINRIDPYHLEWQPTKARKEHECIRGCRIEEGHIYFKREIGAGWGSEWKVCAGCMAMILYYKEVYNLPRYIYSHWNIDNSKPVLEESSDFPSAD